MVWERCWYLLRLASSFHEAFLSEDWATLTLDISLVDGSIFYRLTSQLLVFQISWCLLGCLVWAVSFVSLNFARWFFVSLSSRCVLLESYFSVSICFGSFCSSFFQLLFCFSFLIALHVSINLSAPWLIVRNAESWEMVHAMRCYPFIVLSTLSTLLWELVIAICHQLSRVLQFHDGQWMLDFV